MLQILWVVFVAGWTALGAPQEISSETVAGLVKEASRLVSENYVFPDRAPVVVAKLRESLDAGRYAGLDAQQLAARLTEDIQAVTRDKHMNVKFNPDQARELSRTRASGGPGPSGERDAYMAKLMADSNYGVPELRTFPGNVRYINLAPAFLWDPGRSPQAFDEAMRFLSAGEAYIIDLRQNGGGSPAAVRYVISHFLPPGQELMTYRMGPQGVSRSTSQSVPAGMLPGKPLYVLIGPGTASASEEFAAHVKNFKLGTLVGSTTAGAGHRNMLFGTPAGFVISVSVGTALHPVTNAGWEGTGIAPDIAVPPAEALEAAQRDAAARIAQAPPAPAQARRRAPRPEVLQMVQAIVDAVNGTDAAVDRLVKEHFSAEYAALRSLEDRRRWFEPIRARLGKISINELRRSAEDTVMAIAAGEKGVTLHFVVTHDESFKITGLGIEEPSAP